MKEYRGLWRIFCYAMFLRKITRDYPAGRVEYLYLVEGYRDRGRVRQRVVANLGRADVLAPHLASLVRLLRPYLETSIGPVTAVQTAHALTYGPVAVARQLWGRLGLGELLSRRCGAEVAERAFVLVAHRLLHPGSEHALAWWLEESTCPMRRAGACFPTGGSRVACRWRIANSSTGTARSTSW